MAKQSKYQSKQFEQLSYDLITILEKHKAPVDLSIMALGNLVSNILLENIQTETQRMVLADTFSTALKNSLKAR
ncbi:hypothetical protein A6046_06990 [[Haemophilus] ducreyi]|uniref:UPF0352 protein HD_1515 n=2 Tax=Haemophilus ducreyi TaxID=730 RepID=Y1515_HAEDU|nr:DUF1414 domain-containing protein [[Haemophilus] ducreyi]Q7VLE3.1 RecName: Full=UPF0352 protein HD_1515 [[Haemophilus] ducreyi 35000HP]AAP96305.1 hypothetical protein HD_1515 [[Haemophilus] ducreyi 35000HP]AKO31241.1 hypothetical protein RY60_05970 [[Haemophilus] ducreyi]AKO32689.1 hypothetical protein RZ57_06035 [[Haemophilus] ducreyi]AKO34138.1 hypothetical protein RZ58_06030 [[Haemophilus] ducreyi]AKO35967.1 hypothetical protein RZ59_05960 [[Haemophilus] ducreyi]